MHDVIDTVPLLDVGPRQRRRSTDAVFPQTRSRRAIPSAALVGLVERAADFLTIAAVIGLTFPLLKLYSPHSVTPHAEAVWTMHRMPTMITVFIACMYTVCLQAVGAYSLSGGLLRVRETSCLLRAVVIGGFLLEMYFLMSQEVSHAASLAGISLLLFCTLLVQKHVLRSLVARLEVPVSSQQRVLLFGDPDRTQHLQEAIRRSSRMRVVTFADTMHDPFVDVAQGLSLAVLRQQHIDTILVAQSQQSEAAAASLRGLAMEAGIPIYFLATFAEGSHAQMDCMELDGHFLFGLYESRETGELQRAAKRAFDVVASASLLVATALPLVVAAVLVKLTSSGPVFFRQVRVGLHGKPFTIFKFRTMHHAACVDSVSPSTSTDPRITRVGRFLRKSSFDELPQLLNVLRGEMAMVGPRPEMPFIVADYKEIHRSRLSVKPGLTGLWQISRHRAQPIHENIEYDLYYLRYRSISFDFAILLHTLVFAVRGI